MGDVPLCLWLVIPLNFCYLEVRWTAVYAEAVSRFVWTLIALGVCTGIRSVEGALMSSVNWTEVIVSIIGLIGSFFCWTQGW